MRTEILIIVAIAVIVTLCLWTQRTLLNSHAILASHWTELYKAVANEDWTKAAAALQTVDAQFRKLLPPLSLIVTHNRLQDIELLLAQLQADINEHSRADALKSVSTLRLQFDFIVGDEVVSLRNIF